MYVDKFNDKFVIVLFAWSAQLVLVKEQKKVLQRCYNANKEKKSARNVHMRTRVHLYYVYLFVMWPKMDQ